MSTKTVKGLLKGLRYISKVFDDEHEEPEMQIGYPTDVKHVAHIGWDGPDNNNGPTWMNDFKADESSSRPNGGDEAKPKKEGKANTSKMTVAIATKDGTFSPVASPSRRTSDGTKKSMHWRPTSKSSSVDSPRKRDAAASATHRSSRRSSAPAPAQDPGTDPNHLESNPHGVVKKVRRRRKVSSEGGSTKSTKAKEKNLNP